MSTNLEIESKAILTKEEYDRLVSNFDHSKIYRQSNYYIDSKELIIRKKDCGLRVREKDGGFELTLKVPAKEGKIEINQQIHNISFNNLCKNGIFPNGEVSKYLKEKLGIEVSSLYVLGELITDRIDVDFKGSLISIDKSMYNSITDYEVECEDDSMKKAIRHLKEFLTQFDIKYKKSPGGKLKRFLETLK